MEGSARRKLKDHHYLRYQSRQKMPSTSMRVDESKKMSKEKPTQNTEKKRNRYVAPYYGSPLKKKEKEKGKTASVRSDPLGRKRADPIRSTLAIWD